MRTTYVIFLLSTLMIGLTFISCQDNDDEDKETITRPVDKINEVISIGGGYIDANTSFSKQQLDYALSHNIWKYKYSIAYDNKHVSQILEKDFQAPYSIPKYLYPDSMASYGDNGLKVQYLLYGKTFRVVKPSWWSNTNNSLFMVIALDYTDKKKQMITDLSSSYAQYAPEKYDYASTYIRTFWEPLEP